MNELEKMKAGLWYDANYNVEILQLRVNAMSLLHELNQTPPAEEEKRQEILKKLLGYLPDGLAVMPPFTCDYGKYIEIGNSVFINSYCYLMDGGGITIGDHTFIGPYCGLYTAAHPLSYKWRDQGLEKALPVKIGSHCWLGANVSVMPGVTIGDGCVIAAGAVVTKDIPDNSLAAGVPARVIRTIDQDAPPED